VTLAPTTIGDGARIASHAIVLGGSNLAPGESIGIFPLNKA
jgi:acetyltransferase-like isoleucine patch superfamily enzyme